MNFKTLSAFLVALAVSCTTAYAAGPGDQGGNAPGGGDTPGGGNTPGGDTPGGGGSSGSFTYDDFISVTTNSDHTLVREGILYGYTDSLSTTVSGGSSVTAIAPGTFAGNTTITAVDLSSCTSLSEIPSDCFAGCSALASVTLPSSCVNVGPGAFADCVSLTTFSGTGVGAVSHDAFRGCTALTAQSSSATLLGSYAYSQSGVTSTDTSSATTLGEGVFAGCASLASATTGTTLPAATFAGCTSLAVTDWSAITEFGAAALAGIPATELTLADGATLGDYTFAADTAVVATTLANSSLPTYTDTSFLGREASYTVNGDDVVRIEANELVTWLMAVADGSTTLTETTVTQPTDDDNNVCYATASLETWLASSSNLDAILAFCYEDGTADTDVLTVDGTNFTFTASSKSAVTVTPVGTDDLTADFTADAVTLAETSTSGVYTATPADTSVSQFFMRLLFEKAW